MPQVPWHDINFHERINIQSPCPKEETDKFSTLVRQIPHCIRDDTKKDLSNLHIRGLT